MKHTKFMINEEECLLTVDFIYEPFHTFRPLIKLLDVMYKIDDLYDEFPGHTEGQIRHILISKY